MVQGVDTKSGHYQVVFSLQEPAVFDETAFRGLALMVFASVISSHASATVRYRVVFLGDRIKGSETKG